MFIQANIFRLLQFSGINQQIRTDIFFPMVNLCWVLCAVFGSIGALKIYHKWQLHHQHHIQITAEIAGWISASLFFLVARIFIRVVFNL